MTRRYANPNKEETRALRKQMTDEINMKRSDLITVVSQLPITEEMKKLVAGSSVGEDELRAIRALCVE